MGRERTLIVRIGKKQLKYMVLTVADKEIRLAKEHGQKKLTRKPLNDLV